ncbi:hypothetical protein MET9862_02609 [Methylobacterium symbioticum]|uniref:Uncharacterized protein n=1 Tax=Methylobacterium symbioticum TaxID=2584084 RepID=A0A509EEW4_9HYPH|nr:hypothetical protein MET9862_02609 [Methylobacterium symbioticum]
MPVRRTVAAETLTKRQLRRRAQKEIAWPPGVS